MTCRYTVTFEFLNRKPETHTGQVKAITPDTCSARAVRAARLALEPRQYSSVVCVLERVDIPASEAEEAEETDDALDSGGDEA